MLNKILALLQSILNVIPLILNTVYDFINKRSRKKDLKHVKTHDKIVEKILKKGDIKPINEELGWNKKEEILDKKEDLQINSKDKKTPVITNEVNDMNKKLWK